MLQKLLDNKCDLSSVDSDGMNILMLFVLKLKDFQIILKSVEVKSSLVNVIQILSFIISKGLNINQ